MFCDACLVMRCIRRASIASVMLFSLTAPGCSGRSETGAHKAPPATAVHLIMPQRRTISCVVEQPSFVESYERSSVFPKMSAYIEKWNVDIGDRVKKGQVLAKLFVPELVEDWGTKKATVTLDQKRIDLAKKLVQVAAADVQAAEAHLAESRAMLVQYQSEVDRWKTQVDRLSREVDKGVVDPQVLLESKNQLRSSVGARDAAQATIHNAEAELIAKQATLEQEQIAVEVAAADLEVAQSEARRLQALVGYLTLPAPFDGVITARNANTFDFVLPATGDPSAMRNSPYLAPAGAAPIYVVERTDVVRIFVDVPEAEANFVLPGTKASVLIQAFDDDPISASVTRTAWALNVKSRTLRAEIDLPNTGGQIIADNVPEFVRKSLAQIKLPNTTSQILPGMYAYGNVLIERHGVWALPKTAVDYNDGKAFYWACKDNHAQRMEVQTGVSDDDWIEIVRLRPLSGQNAPWVPVNASAAAIVCDDDANLGDGALVHVASDHESPAHPGTAGTR